MKSNTTGETIRSARKAKNMTQAQLAQAAGIAVNSVRLYEAGKLSPKIETLQKIATALNVSVYVLTGQHTENYEDGSEILVDNALTDEEKLKLHTSEDDRLKALLSTYHKLNPAAQDTLVRIAMELASSELCKKGVKLVSQLSHDYDSDLTDEDYSFVDKLYLSTKESQNPKK